MSSTESEVFVEVFEVSGSLPRGWVRSLTANIATPPRPRQQAVEDAERQPGEHDCRALAETLEQLEACAAKHELFRYRRRDNEHYGIEDERQRAARVPGSADTLVLIPLQEWKAHDENAGTESDRHSGERGAPPRGR